MPNMDAVLNYKFDSLSRRITDLEVSQSDNIAKSERSGVAFTGRIYETLSAAPLAADENTDFAFAFIRNVRKPGEGAGTGTGTFCYYNPATDQWFRASDESVAVI